MKRSIVLVLLALGACGDTAGEPDRTSPPATEIVNASGRIKGTTYTLDVQIGHGVQQRKTTSTTYTFEGNAAVKP